ncbi:hypothetical protein AB1460_28670, partial [Parafrankia sp. FMc2]
MSDRAPLLDRDVSSDGGGVGGRGGRRWATRSTKGSGVGRPAARPGEPGTARAVVDRSATVAADSRGALALGVPDGRGLPEAPTAGRGAAAGADAVDLSPIHVSS